MAINFPHTNRAIDRFVSGQQIDNNERRAENAEFERMRLAQQGAGVDRALREGFGGFYANRPNPATATAVPPAATAAPAAPAAAPAQQQAPATTQMPEIFAPNPAETGTNLPQAVASPGGSPVIQGDIPKPPANVTPPTDSLKAAVSTAAGPPRPAIAGFNATSPDQTNAMMQRLAQTPGAGTAMASLHERNQQHGERAANRDMQATRLRQAAEIQAIKALHSGDPQIALAIASHYNINIPPEVIKNAGFQQSMKNLGTLIKGNGITDDVMAATITRNYLQAKSEGADEQTAMTRAFSNAGTPQAKAPKRTWDSVRGTWVEEPTDANPNGRALQPPGTPARQVSAGGGRADAGKQSVFQQKQSAWLELNPGDRQGALDFASGKKGVTPADIQRAANNLLNASKSITGKPTMTWEQAVDRARAKLSGQGASGTVGTRPPSAIAGRPPLSSFERP